MNFLSKLRFSHEPIVWIGAIIAVVTLVVNLKNGEPLTESLVQPVLSALGALIGRQLVIPVAKK